MVSAQEAEVSARMALLRGSGDEVAQGGAVVDERLLPRRRRETPPEARRGRVVQHTEGEALQRVVVPEEGGVARKAPRGE